MKSANQDIKPVTYKINNLGHIEIGGIDMVELAKEYKTPLYVIDEKTVRTIAQQYKEAFSSLSDFKMMYASKALLTTSIAKIMQSEGFGFDVVSGGEIYTLLKAGISLKEATFNGSNKTLEELEYALDNGIGRISVDNFYELELLKKLTKSKNIKQKILLRITPGIDCHTHKYIQTGHLDSKFGFDLTQLDSVIEKLENLELVGLHAHIGSQIFETKVYEDEIKIILNEYKRIKDKFNIELNELNAGGGMGIKYTDSDLPPSIYQIADIMIKALNENSKKLNIKMPKLLLEPGRSIISTSGVTLYTIGSSKNVPNVRKYIAVDGGMSDNPRPSLYEAQYYAQVANKANEKNTEKVTVAGRFCESGDILIKDIELPKTEAGDILCVFSTGAYNYSMASNYNMVTKPQMILVNNSQSDIIVKRETYQELTQNNLMPERLK